LAGFFFVPGGQGKIQKNVMLIWRPLSRSILRATANLFLTIGLSTAREMLRLRSG